VPSLAPLPLVILATFVVPTSPLQAQGSPPAASAPQGTPVQGRGAVPNLTAAEPMGPPENLAAYPVPPEGFNVARADIPHGEIKLVEYDSKMLGIRRPLRLYLPPG
jgi:hypothetical protein